jgi:hypothetical protein
VAATPATGILTTQKPQKNGTHKKRRKKPSPLAGKEDQPAQFGVMVEPGGLRKVTEEQLEELRQTYKYTGPVYPVKKH